VKIPSFAFAAAGAAAVLGYAAVAATPTASGKPVVAGNLVISGAWARAAPAGMPVGAAYFTIENRGKQPDGLLAIASSAAAKVELHRTTVENGMSRMRPAGEIVIAPGSRISVAPGGLHLMLMDLKYPLLEGNYLPLTFTFRRAGKITVQIRIQKQDTL
jgi:periplasmic copper chaperone A